jgi:hypothetical protein
LIAIKLAHQAGYSIKPSWSRGTNQSSQTIKLIDFNPSSQSSQAGVLSLLGLIVDKSGCHPLHGECEERHAIAI